VFGRNIIMSKVGRKSILFTSAKVVVEGGKIIIQGQKEKFEHDLPDVITARLEEKSLKLEINRDNRINRMLWGLHRALIANKIIGVEKGFEKKISIVGLGYKAVVSGKKLVFTLGYTNKIDYELPERVTVNIDKSGQQLLFKSADKFLLGNVCDRVRSFRPPEPYKGTGIIRENDVIMRKAGKTKGA
jgi:large subunit ribosomal protein L6